LASIILWADNLIRDIPEEFAQIFNCGKLHDAVAENGMLLVATFARVMETNVKTQWVIKLNVYFI